MPVDFNKLRSNKPKQAPSDPLEIFRRLPRSPGITDLYTSQAQVLETWFRSREKRDTVLKLHTGGGKTLVALLMAQSTINERHEPVLYLVPNSQLATQVLEQASSYGIAAVAYTKGQPLDDAFINGRAVLVATYKALFNGRTKFGLRGAPEAQSVGAIILDDAHVAFSEVRDSFTLEVNAATEPQVYKTLIGLFRAGFRAIDKLGTFDDVASGGEFGVLEVPHWSWLEQLDAVRELFPLASDNSRFVWPLLRDHLHLCHALVSRSTFTITPVLPLIDMFPTFADAHRRIYVSATIADDSEIIRTFGADPEAAGNFLSSRSLAGVTERMILIPDLMPFSFDVRATIKKLLPWITEKGLGAVVLVPSNRAAKEWDDCCELAEGPEAVESAVSRLRAGDTIKSIVLANRYDGIDLPHDSCRFLVMFGLPRGTNDYEVFRATALHGSATITRLLAQRLEQGIGRGARGAGDYCVVVLAGSDLAAWIAREANFRLLTSATRAQLEMGTEVSSAVAHARDLAITIKQCIERDQSWIEYHAETLAELVDDAPQPVDQLRRAGIERKAFELWRDGHYDQAISRLEREFSDLENEDRQACGWLQQMASQIAENWGNHERADDLQRQAYSNNRNLTRPRVRPPYRPLATPGPQSRAIVNLLGIYRVRRGLLQSFEDAVALLSPNASANQFEQALVDLATQIGLSAERFDQNGEGPDVLWLYPGTGYLIEAKSRKRPHAAFTKEEHGQLLVAEQWFNKNYANHDCVRISVYPTNRATAAAAAEASFALTYEGIARLVADTRAFLISLCDSQLPSTELVGLCHDLLERSQLRWDRLGAYLAPFVVSTKK